MHDFFLSSVSRNRRLEALNFATFNSSLNTAVETGMLQCRKHVPMTLDSRNYVLPDGMNVTLCVKWANPPDNGFADTNVKYRAR